MSGSGEMIFMKKAAIVAAVLAALPVTAQAQDSAPNFWSQPGFYIGFGGGAFWHLGEINSSCCGTFNSYTGFSLNGAIGYDFVGLRAQAEVGFSMLPTN